MEFKNYWLYKNFHIHPIIIKNLNNNSYFSHFSPSIDEDFIKIYKDTKFYVSNDSDEMLFASKTKISEMNVNFIPFDSYTFANWGKNHLRDIHLKIFKEHTYILKFTEDIDESNLKNDMQKIEN